VFGGTMFKAWLEYKRAEWQDYQTHISDWERARYFTMF
jgi:glutamine synthetase